MRIRCVNKTEIFCDFFVQQPRPNENATYMNDMVRHYTNAVEIVAFRRNNEFEIDLGQESEINAELDENDKLTPGDLLAFAWQVSKGMVGRFDQPQTIF